MEDLNWKDIKRLVEGFTDKKESEPKITPILAHASYENATLDLGLLSVFFAGTSNEQDSYSYVSTLIEKQGRYHTKTRAFLKNEGNEIPVMDEERSFPKEKGEKPRVLDHLRHSLYMFKSKDNHIKVMTFKNSDMSEKDFNNIIELWRNSKPQTQS